MTKKITFSGMGCAISVVILLLTNIFPFNTAFLLCIATVVFPVIKMKCGTSYAAAAVFASCVLSFVLLAEKIYVLTFSLLAVYSIIKGIIERFDRMWLEWVLKLVVYFIGAAAVLKIFMPGLLLQGILAGVIIFVIYDVALSVFVTFARQKLKL